MGQPAPSLNTEVLWNAGTMLNPLWKVSVAQSCPTLCDPMDCSPPDYSVHGIFQARILEWVAISSSRGSFQPRDGTRVSCIAGGFFIISATKQAPMAAIKTSPGHCWVFLTGCFLSTYFNILMMFAVSGVLGRLHWFFTIRSLPPLQCRQCHEVIILTIFNQIWYQLALCCSL